MSSLVAPTVSIRLRQPADRAFLERLARDAFGEYSADGGRTAIVMIERLSTLVASRGEQPVGFATLERLEPGVAALAAIAVVERERGQGVGQRLLNAAEARAASWGARRLELHTAEANLAAFELFVRAGYRLVGRIPRFYRGVFGACVMVKPLRGRRE